MLGRHSLADPHRRTLARHSCRSPLWQYLLAANYRLPLGGCDWFDKKKPPLVGERLPVFTDRKELEPDKEAGSIQVTLPPPAANESWPQSGGYPNYAMQHRPGDYDRLLPHDGR